LDAAVRRCYEDPAQVAAFTAASAEGLTPFEAALLHRAFGAGHRVLDVGCGGGREAVPMVRAGLRVIAMDLSLAMVRAATAFAAAQGVAFPALVGSAAALPFREGAFDGVALLGQVIAHVPGRGGRVDALRGAWRALRPGGTLAMTTHNHRCHWKLRLYFAWVNRWRRLRRALGVAAGLGEYDRWSARVSRARSRRRVFFHMYDLEEAVSDMQAAGFEVVLARARAELEAGREDPRLRRRDYLLGFLARRPEEGVA
jgi:SAM-dependent methyltransferase